MLRLILQWFAETKTPGHEFSFASDARWFSEARLASTFLPRYRGDPFAEGYTCADGTIGHFDVGKAGLAELALASDARQFIVAEAKMFSGLSKGTSRAPTYNQAARNIACMAELLRIANRDPSEVSVLAFFVIAPRQQIQKAKFVAHMDLASLARVVAERVGSYDAPKVEWYEKWFLPTLNAIRIDCLAWETVISFIQSAEASFGQDLNSFCQRCLEFNRLERAEVAAKQTEMASASGSGAA